MPAHGFRNRERERNGEAPKPAKDETFQGKSAGSTDAMSCFNVLQCNAHCSPNMVGSVNQGLQLHDRAEKRRQADPAAACALYREAIAAYKVQSDHKKNAEHCLMGHFKVQYL